MIPPIQAIIETGVYVDDLSAAARFYGEVLELPLAGEEPGRHLFYRVGDAGMLLVFCAESTLRGDHLPSHGAIGPGHFALGVPGDALELWKARLRSHSIDIEQEVEWPRGGRSIYVRDPAGNSVELLTPGLWGLPSGW